MSGIAGASEYEPASELLADAVRRLARGEKTSFEGLLVTVGSPQSIVESRVSCRTHFVCRDANGRVRVKALADALALQVVDFCIPRSRAKAAMEVSARTGSMAEVTRLTDEARALFTSLENSGEGGELLLYSLLETVLGIPQILCKMPLKTSTAMHVHGTDGIHATALDDGRLALYWGESKLHANVNSAIDSAFQSIVPFLLDEGGGAASRDLLLIRDNLDTGDLELTAALIRYFDTGAGSANVEFRAACLVGFDMAEYPHPHEADGETITAQAQAAIDACLSRVSDRISDHAVSQFEIEVFLVPFPSVTEFRSALRDRLGKRR